MKITDLLNIQNQFFKTEDSDTKTVFYVVLTHSLIKELQPILIQNDLYHLGFISVFEIRGGSKEGILLGYAFYTKQHKLICKRNFLLVKRGEVDVLNIFKTHESLELKYKVDCISAFVIENAILITLDYNHSPLISKLTGNK